MKNVYLSYSWIDSSLADQLDILFKTKGILPIRDIRDVEYKESIKRFMKKIRNADFSVIIISKDYLHSQNCMYEVLEFIKDDNFKDKILPLIRKDTEIFTSVGRSEYIKFWQDKFHVINKKRAKINPLNQPDLILDLKVLENIQRSIGEFLSLIADMRLIKIEADISINNFNDLYKYINPEDHTELILDDPEGYFIVNIPRTLDEKIFVWWKSDSYGYTHDIRNAKIFSRKEIEEKLGADKSIYKSHQWNSKKFLAVPIVDVALKLDSYIIPFVPYYKNKIETFSELLFGNKHMTLSEDEIIEYG